LRGTQLQQLSDEYDTIRTNISLTSKMLEKKQEVLPDLEAAKNEAATKYEEAKVAREQRYKVDQLKRELAWAHVRSKELVRCRFCPTTNAHGARIQELEGKMRDVAKIENKIPGGQRHRDEAQAQVNQASEEVAQFEKDHADFGSPDELVAQRNDIGAEIKRNAAEIARLARDIKDMNDSMSSFQKVIVACEENIAKETAKLAAKEAGRQQELEGRLKLAHDTFKAAEEEFRTLQEKHGEQRAETEKMAVTGRRLEGEMGTIRQQMDGLRATMERVRRSQSHPLAAYGEGMPKALDTIKNAQWHGDIPIGPFGLHVKLRDQRWASVVRNRLGNAMFSFLVTDARDRVQLQRILQNARW
jgi:chromosome segregation ATPase